jgi:hypothetical protein
MKHSLLQRLIIAQLVRNSPNFMEPEGLLSHSKEPNTGSHSEPRECISHPFCCKIHFNIILRSTPRSPKRYTSLKIFQWTFRVPRASHRLWFSHRRRFRGIKIIKSRHSSVGIALGYGLDDQGSRVRFPAGAGNFSLHHRVQNGSGAHPPSYPRGTPSLGVKRPGHEADHSPPSSAEVKE